MNVLNTCFDKIYVVTCGQHQNRIKYIKELFSKENINFDFHYAVDATFLDASILNGYLEYLKNNNCEDTLPSSIYRISATISHLQMLRQFQYSDYNNVLIFEDDVYFTENYQTKIKTFMENVPKDWDILNLGRNYSYKDSQIRSLNTYVNVPQDLYGAHAYAFSKNKIIEFCDYLEHKHQLPWGPDPHFVKMYMNGYKSYVPSEFIVGALSQHNKDPMFIKTNECFESIIS